MALLIFVVVLLLVLSVVGSTVAGSDPRPFPPDLPARLFAKLGVATRAAVAHALTRTD
jgi:hypothetical protein